MIVTMIAMWVVKMPAHEVIDMVAVRDGLMPTARPVLVVLRVLATVVVGCASGWIDDTDRQAVFFDLTCVLVIQMTVMEVVGVAVMLDADMATAWPMLVLMAFRKLCHDQFPLLLCSDSVPLSVRCPQKIAWLIPLGRIGPWWNGSKSGDFPTHL